MTCESSSTVFRRVMFPKNFCKHTQRRCERKHSPAQQEQSVALGCFSSWRTVRKSSEEQSASSVLFAGRQDANCMQAAVLTVSMRPPGRDVTVEMTCPMATRIAVALVVVLARCHPKKSKCGAKQSWSARCRATLSSVFVRGTDGQSRRRRRKEPKHLNRSEANNVPGVDQRTPVEDESAEGIERADQRLHKVPAVGWGVSEGREEAHRHRPQPPWPAQNPPQSETNRWVWPARDSVDTTSTTTTTCQRKSTATR